MEPNPSIEHYQNWGPRSARHYPQYSGVFSYRYSNEACEEYELQISSESESEGENEEEKETQETDSVDFSISRVTHAISIDDNTLFEEEDYEFEYDSNYNPLDQGLFFKLLFKKFNDHFLNKSQSSSQSLTDNLLMTNIFCKLASVPLSSKNIETYYLHAFLY